MTVPIAALAARILAAVEALFHHLGPENVGRHQVGGELHPQRLEPHDDSERLDQLGLGEAGNADQQSVPAGEQRHQRLLDHPFLAEDHCADRLARRGDARQRRFGGLHHAGVEFGDGHALSFGRTADQASGAGEFPFAGDRTRLKRRLPKTRRNIRTGLLPTNKREIVAAGDAPESALGGLAEAAAAAARGRGPAPVHLWNPPYCGEIDMRIAADGTWFYGGSPIGRPALVRLFASILRKDVDRHVLVTPVERVGIAVDDAPFVAVEMEVGEAGGARRLAFRTNVDDFVAVDADHPLRFERAAADGIKPYVRVRGDLWALVKRALYYDLVALGEVAPMNGEDWFGVRSGGQFFAIARASEIEGL